MKISTLLPLLISGTILGCGGSDSEPNTTEQPIEPPTIAEPTVKPITEPLIPGTDTGSTTPELIKKDASILLAQVDSNMYHPRYGKIPQYEPVFISLYGENTDNTLELTTEAPPLDVTPCNNGVILYSKVPSPDIKYYYNSWWLFASSTNTNQRDQETNKKVYFYWAKEISDDELGLVPIITDLQLEKPENKKLDLGYTTLPYQWVSQLENYINVPVNPEVSCEK